MCSGALSCGAASTGGGCLCGFLGSSQAMLCAQGCAAGCVPGADPYVLIKCEKQSRRSAVQRGTTSPVFNTQVIFYTKDMDSPVTIQVRQPQGTCSGQGGQHRASLGFTGPTFPSCG